VTPALELTAKQKIEHKVHRYKHDRKAESYGEEAAQLLAVDAAQVFKTLVVELSSGKLAVALVPVNKRLDLKALAQAAKAKKAVMADKHKVQRTTGYVLGGVSPLGQKRSLLTIIDQSATELSTIYVSAGKRGLEIELAPADLAHLCKASFASISA